MSSNLRMVLIDKGFNDPDLSKLHKIRFSKNIWYQHIYIDKDGQMYYYSILSDKLYKMEMELE